MNVSIWQEAINLVADAAAEHIVDYLVLFEGQKVDDRAVQAIAQAAFSFMRWLDAVMDTRGFTESQRSDVLIQMHRAIDARMELDEWFNPWDGE